MELKMKIGKEVVDAVVLNPSKVKDERYLNALKEELRRKHQQKIAQLQKQPMFYIEIKSNFSQYN
jgi:riboflavin synthase